MSENHTIEVRASHTPTIVPRPEHIISRSNISENAVKVLYRLKKSGFQAHLVGGSVRDLLLGREPKDFDVATDAHPEQVRGIFRNCRLIGRRFRLAHVHFGREIIEVATFRAAQDEEGDGQRKIENGMLLRDNAYGSIEEDAARRDFTINALYYNIADFSILDYANGLQDLESGVLRLIGSAEQRYREDPVRMLRAVRFAAKLGFNIEPQCADPIATMGVLLQEVPPARLFEEVLKLFLAGSALQTFEKLRHYGLFVHLFPETEASLAGEEQAFPITFVNRGLENTDLRVGQDKPVTPAFLFAILLWEPVRQLANDLQQEGMTPLQALQEAGEQVLSRQLQAVSIPKRFSYPMREIWVLQQRFEHLSGKRPHRLLTHPRFRAAYDFLVLRAQAGEADPELASWWTRFQELDSEQRHKLTKPAKGSGRCRGRGRNRRPEP